jgi:hypothetical protein
MDQTLRGKLRSVVTQCRALLEGAVREALDGQHGIRARGKDEVEIEDEPRLTHLSDEDRQSRREVLDHLRHIQAQRYTPKDALAQLVREIAFTHLNRLCAYKMMESRGLIREAVSRGVNSNGFKFYLADHPEDERRHNAGQQDVAYRHFLRWQGEQLSDEIGVLFSPHDSASRLFPPQRVLDEVLGLINGDDLRGVWTEDEAIGWVYQYFTPKELRDQARKESQAPRNSYELAFRNQFFTPRYVVEFLTDNTLGRIWYEMRKGRTRLAERCRYLVRRPTEVFLAEGETAPAEEPAGEDVSQEELLRRPVHVPHRPKKDPRELKVLDPACGSGHFLLYCFDLLLVIYEEAYDDPDLGPALKRDYPTLGDLRKATPGLILSRNLHGIDIDLRATQIAALALWLRAQRAWAVIGDKKDRPKVNRTNIICAEPMPGENDLLEEFVAGLEPKVLGQLVRDVFERMKLAGEAGSLLTIEDNIADIVAEAKKEWSNAPSPIQRSLFGDTIPARQQRFDLSGVTDAEFWNSAESKVVEALREYARRTVNGKGFQRQLFAGDAERGFAFVDVCRQKFDVALMNPPFGTGSLVAKKTVDASYPLSKNDLYAAFVERGVQLLDVCGVLGAITSRTGFFLKTFQQWREAVVLGTVSPVVFADLGAGVLDSAMVETCAYCLEKGRPARPSLFLRALHTENKAGLLAKQATDLGSSAE